MNGKMLKITSEDIAAAMKRYRDAVNALDNADPELAGPAELEVQAAMDRLDTMIKIHKEGLQDDSIMDFNLDRGRVMAGVRGR